MNRELQNILCSCSSDCVGNTSNRYVQPKDDYNDHDVNCPRYDSDRDDKLLNDWKVLDDDSWDVISALRQKFCLLSKSEAESATVKESPQSSCTYTNGQPYEYHCAVERASNLIDYTPESEFLRKIKQQCQYLHNRLPNIFSALNDCFPEGEVNECQKCLPLRPRVHFSSSTSWKCSSYDDDTCSIFQRPCSEKDKNYPLERLEVGEKKSKHVSRSKKPGRRRKIKKRKSNDSGKCLSENEFEPSLKKPNENSCERCWRYASPSRSPVNKPDQRYDPNFRRAHSTTTFDKGDGEFDNLAEAQGAAMSESRNVSPSAVKDLPCAKHTCDTGQNRLFQGSVQPPVPPHICIRQKMEAAMHMGQGCPKHRLSNEQPQAQFPDEYVSPQRGCSKLRGSPQQPQNAAPPPQHVCPKHFGAAQQSEGGRQKHKCPIHDVEPPQKSPQQRCSQQRSPQQGLSREGRQPCRQSPGESPRGILCSGKKSKPQSYGSGSRDAGRSPCGAEDLDVTEYKDICTKARKQALSPSPDPCHRVEHRKAVPTCGGCPPKPTRTCEPSKMEPIPEGDTSRKDGNDNGNNGRGKSGSLDSKAGRGDTDGKKGGDTDGRKGGDLDSKSSKSKSKSPAPKKEKPEKSPPSKKGKSDGKALKEKPRKKSPEKPKPKKDDDSGNRGACGNKSTNNQFDKAHPIRPCKCPPRLTDAEFGPASSGCGGHTLCCHCDWGENNNNLQVNSAPQPTRANGSPGCGCNTPRKNTAPEMSPPVPRAGAMECPYRTFMNKYGTGRGSPCGAQQEESRRCSREDHSEISTQELLQCTPRKYFVFYMSNAKEKKNENDVEVLVEEMGQGCSKNGNAGRRKDITEKMRKISEPPPDSMALRFQKGVSEACNVPQSSRILYF